MRVEVLALWQKGRRPKFKESKVWQNTLHLEGPLIFAKGCIHTNFKHEVCGEKVDEGRPHGWLCTHHDMVTREREHKVAA